MSTTFIIEAKNRQSLTNGLDMALIGQGMQIRAGTYEVTVRRLSKKEVAKMEAEEKEEARVAAEAEAERKRQQHAQSDTESSK